jgi:hypothetical protein
MKMIKMALLGGAALAVTSAGAYADDLDALKAQIESLNARVAAMEAAPAIPAGYSLLTVSEGEQIAVPGLETLRKDRLAEGSKATIISVLPTADAPAGTEISWSGYARAAIVYYDVQGGGDADWDVYARGQIKVTGKTDTAVGEVGARVNLRGNLDGERGGAKDGKVYVEEAWGWWAMTPELTLGGGFTGSLGNIGYGYDGACNCYYTDNADVALNPGDTTQMRLTYASGPFSMAVALEDATGGGPGYSGWASSGDNELGVAGEMKYSGDMFSGEISAVWRNGAAGFEDVYAVGAGVGFALGDVANLSLGAQTGQYNTGVNFVRASALASANLTDAIHAEVAYGYTDKDAAGNNVNAVLAGVYYDPVSQLTIGLEGEWINPEGSNNNSTQIDLVTVFRF